MLLTLFLSFVLMFALSGLIFAAVAFIQDRRFFTTAPKDIQAAAVDHPERFRGQRALGWVLAIFFMALIAGAFIYGAYDGVKNGFTFWDLWLRFALMLYLWKAFDIICLDWLLLTKSHFFQRYYPETEGCAGYSSFGFNRKEQLFRIAIFPFVAAAMAFVTMLVGGLL